MAAVSASSIIPVLRYRDAAAAIEWLAETMGFDKKLVVPGEGGSIRHAQLTFGEGLVMLGSERRGEPADSGAMYVVVADIEPHYEHARQAGAEIVTPLERQEDRGLFYACRDPEGRVWNCGQYDPWDG